MVTTDEALEAILRAPDLLWSLAGEVGHAGRRTDGSPRGRDLQSTPARTAVLAQIDETFVGLWRLERDWRAADTRPLGDTEFMIRFDDMLRPIGPRGTISTPQGAHVLRAWATTLVNRIEYRWPTIEAWHQNEASFGAAAWEEFVTALRPWLLAPLRRLDEPAEHAPRGRQCPVCGQWDVWADVAESVAVCGRCGPLARWLPVADAAKVIGRTDRTVRRWVQSGELPSRTVRGTAFVEVGEARIVAEVASLRQRAGVKRSA